jgi:hypothetical protein
MKNLKQLALMLGLIMALAACGAPAGPASAPTPAVAAAAVTTPGAASGALTEDYEDALSVRNQLAYGTLKLEGAAEAVTAEQAAKLLPLWQALKALDDSATAATEESAAAQTQIQAALTPAQVASIAGMRLTNAMLQAYYVEIGVSEIKTPEPGVTPQSSSFKDLPPEQREAAKATAQALGTPVGGSSSAKKDALLDNVIELLTNRAAGK